MPTNNSQNPAPSTAKLVSAFAAIYLIWGSTYLGIRYAIETIPPLLMAAMRFFFGGLILFAWAWRQGARPAGPAGWKSAAIVGLLLLLGGNGSVVIAEQWVASGVAALLIACTPLWIAFFEWIAPGGKRPRLQVAVGILMGLGGVLLLINPGEIQPGAIDLSGAAILMAGSMFWSIGSLYGRHAKSSSSPIMTSGMQMISGGACLLIAGGLAGEFARFRIQSISTVSLVAFLYLMIFGSIVAFTAYSWLVTATTPARLTTYAYVNPVVAVFLGWAIASEPLTARMLLAMVIVVSGVVVITRAKQ
jgi:drug/metabolite transporter (DMT)-like permease